MRNVVRTLSLAIGVFSAGLSLATFLTLVNLKLVLPAVALMVPASLGFVLLFRKIVRPSTTWTRILAAQGLYAIAVSVGYYLFADGASRVAFIDGHYVALYKGQILRTISEAEAQQFPNWWTRVSAAWIALVAFAQAAWIPGLRVLANVAR